MDRGRCSFMVTVISHNPAETFALGELWGRAAEPGWIIGLHGDLGAGKTQLVKGIAHGLGITRPILSPTFALIHQYPCGRHALFHLDLYRLENEAQIRSAGLEEFFDRPGGIAVIEWIERWPEPIVGNYRQVTIEVVSETERRISYEDFGS